jgi:hypothetical protein
MTQLYGKSPLPELDSGHREKDHSTGGDCENANREVQDSLVGFSLPLGREPVAPIYLPVWMFLTVCGLCFTQLICERPFRHVLLLDPLELRSGGMKRRGQAVNREIVLFPTS